LFFFCCFKKCPNIFQVLNVFKWNLLNLNILKFTFFEKGKFSVNIRSWTFLKIDHFSKMGILNFFLIFLENEQFSKQAILKLENFRIDHFSKLNIFRNEYFLKPRFI
jgi:hypothetical protein